MKRNIKNLVVIMILIIAGFTVVNFALAETLDTGIGYGEEIGLGDKDPRLIVANVIRIALGFLGVIAVALIMYAGWLYMSAGGEAEKVEKAKKLLTAAIIGLVIILSAFGIASFILSKILDATGSSPGGGPIDPIDPWSKYFHLNSTVPVDGSTDVVQNVRVRFNFNKSISSESVDDTNFTVSNGGGDIEGTINVSGKTIEFIPSGTCPVNLCDATNCFSENDNITVTVSDGPDGVLSGGGLEAECTIGEPCTITFNTRSEIDCESPTANLYFNSGQVCINTDNEIFASAKDDSGISNIEFFEGSILIEDKVNPPGLNPFNTSVIWDGSGQIEGTNKTFKISAYDLAYNSVDDLETVSLKAEHCCNGIIDSDESEIDCGGSDCAACAGSACSDDIDVPASCSDTLCASNFCSPLGSDAASCALAGYENGVDSCCLCSNKPRIDAISPLGGYCDGSIDTVCKNDSDCSAFNPSTCNVDNPNGKIGNLVTISGKYFGESIGEVYFTGADGMVLASLPSTVNFNCTDYWSDEEIIIVVPNGATNGPIKVKNISDGLEDLSNDGNGANIKDFLVNNIERPGICKLAPDSGVMNDTLFYHGINFESDNKVYFGEYSGGNVIGINTSFIDSSTINSDVPNIKKGKVTSYILNTNNIISNYIDFEKEEEPYSGPNIVSFEPYEGNIGQYITIKGSGFGNSQGTSHIYFDLDNDVKVSYEFPEVCSDSFWSDSQVIVKVPSGIIDGDYTITMVKGSDTVNTSSLNPNKFKVNSDLALLPSLCKIEPIMGPNNSEISLWGEYFDDVDSNSKVRFHLNHDYYGSYIDSWKLDDSASGIKPYKIDTTVHQDAVSGGVRVIKGSPENVGNAMNFEIGLCSSDSDCGSQTCCPSSSVEEGKCKDAINDCYGSVASSVYEWDFSTASAPIDPPTTGDSCIALSQISGSCDSVGCPNSPGKCSLGEIIFNNSCGDTYCATAFGSECGSDCIFDNNANKCIVNVLSLEDACSVFEGDTFTVDENTIELPFDYKEVECKSFGTDYYWQIKPNFLICPNSNWELNISGWCTLVDPSTTPSSPQKCDACESGFSCKGKDDVDNVGMCFKGTLADACSIFEGDTFTVDEEEIKSPDGYKKAECRKLGTDYYWQIDPISSKCPDKNWELNEDGWCTLVDSSTTPSSPQKCDACESGFSCKGKDDVDNVGICFKEGLTTTCSIFEGDTFKVNENEVESPDDYKGAECKILGNNYYWQINPGLFSCPTENWELNVNGWCTLVDPSTTPSVPQKCFICDSGFDCESEGLQDNIGKCYIGGRVCPTGVDCVGGKCDMPSVDQCECCCRIDNANQDCCASLTCAGDCGNDSVIVASGGADPNIYGTCSGCRIDSNGDGSINSAEQVLSDQACNCSTSSGKYCDVEADVNGDGTPEGACRDCNQLPTTGSCSTHYATCCVDAMDSDSCKGEGGYQGLENAPDLSNYYCGYYRCDKDLENGCYSDGSDYIKIADKGDAYTGNVYSAISDCENQCQEGGGPGMSCFDEIEETCTLTCNTGYGCIGENGCSGSPTSCSEGDTTCACCCDPGTPDDPNDPPDTKNGLECRENISPCDGDDRGLYCGCSEDLECGAIITAGCGKDTCCRPRPSITEEPTPADGALGVCRNALISATFNQKMDISSFTGNMIVVGDYGTEVCPSGTEYIAEGSINKKNIIARLINNISSKFKGLISILSKNLKQAIAYTSPVPAKHYCAVPGTVQGEHIGDDETVIKFSLSKSLEKDRLYYVIIKGDENLDGSNGVLNDWGVGYRGPSTEAFNGISYRNSKIWSFSAGSDICLLNSVEINPKSKLFQEVGQSQIFTSSAKSANDQTIVPVLGEYNWRTDWSIDNESVVKFLDGMAVANSNNQTIEAQNKQDAKTFINAKTIITEDKVSSISTIGDEKVGKATAYVFLCQNPWPAVDSSGAWSPWTDTNANCGSKPCPDTNYELYYCRDDGSLSTVDDLPAIDSLTKGYNLELVCSDGNACSTYGEDCGTDNNYKCVYEKDLLKEAYFFRETVPLSSGSNDIVSLVSENMGEGSKITLKWCPTNYLNSENPDYLSDIKNYNVYYSNNHDIAENPSSATQLSNVLQTPISASTAIPVLLTNCYTSNAYEYTVDNLINGKEYYFVVTPINSVAVLGDFSNEVSITPSDTLAPSVPVVTDVLTGFAKNTATVKWTTTPGVDKYKIFYSAGDCTTVGNYFASEIIIDSSSSAFSSGEYEMSSATGDLITDGFNYCLAMQTVR